jgi:hypothetical protein
MKASGGVHPVDSPSFGKDSPLLSRTVCCAFRAFPKLGSCGGPFRFSFPSQHPLGFAKQKASNKEKPPGPPPRDEMTDGYYAPKLALTLCIQTC